MVDVPKLKKKVGSFLTKEDGKISKENIIKAGTLLSVIAIASADPVHAGHTNTNTLSVGYESSSSAAWGQHSHENHSSY